MAANYVTVTPALAELISSLPQDEVPIKLRCAICSKLAVNAFRTPCCEQMICENCKLSLPSTCPVCEHTPISAEDCKPNKSLRMTTRAFLKTAEKKRDSLQAKEATPITPIDAKSTATPSVTEQAAPPVEPTTDGNSVPKPTQEQEHVANTHGPTADGQPAATVSAEEVQDDAPSVENKDVPPDDQAAGDPENQDKQVENRDGSNEENGDTEAAVVETNDGDETDNMDQQKSSFPNSFGFGGMNGQFPNMNNFGGGDFNQMNQMQMMMAMQNGMAPNGFGFPMMGMPGMNMDPSMMNMYQMSNGFGAPGMDMSMMNGGMGGFNGGTGSEENWNGPQSWNNGQNNYNHPNASGMGNGDYGNFNSGYNTGYNQGNFGPNNNFNDFRGRGYFRGRGRGRGFGNYGRGGYGYGQQGNFQGQNQNYMHQQQYGNNMMGSQGPHAATNISGEDESDKNVDEYGRTLRHEGNGSAGSQNGEEKVDGSEPINENGDRTSNMDGAEGSVTADSSGQQTSAIEALQPGPRGDPTGSAIPAGDPRMNHNGLPFGNHQRGVSFGGMPPPAAPAPDVPLNAPKGPKAMRQGLPNTSLLNLRARGYQIPGDNALSNANNRVQSPSVQSGPGGLATPVDDERDRRRSRSNSIASSVKRRSGESENHRERSRSRSRSGRDKERDRSHRERRGKHREASASRSPSRSRSREHKDRKRKSHRSSEEEDRDYEKERRHRHRSSKRHHDDEEIRSSREDKHDDRSRSASPAGSRKTSHRSSRKDRDAEKRRDRDRERDRDNDDDRDYKRKSSHRSSHRDRDRERDGKERDRKRDRDRDRDREKRRSRHATAEPPTPTEPSTDKEIKEFNPPTGPRGSISKNYSIFNTPKGFEIKGAFSKASASAIPKGPAADREKEGSRRSSTSTAAPAKGGLDPHAAEREARNRERLLKETQRLAGLTGVKRRGTDDGEESSRSRKRKMGRRGGEVAEEDEEARMKRSEAEREGSRWG